MLHEERPEGAVGQAVAVEVLGDRQVGAVGDHAEAERAKGERAGLVEGQAAGQERRCELVAGVDS